MGYAVYKDFNVSIDRWAGYGVPAECDMPDCHNEIDRGLAYKCEAIDEKAMTVGCGLFFCYSHLYLDHCPHKGVKPKPDGEEWNRHILSDETWEEWRRENPVRVAQLRSAMR